MGHSSDCLPPCNAEYECCKVYIHSPVHFHYAVCCQRDSFVFVLLIAHSILFPVLIVFEIHQCGDHFVPHPLKFIVH